MSNIPAMPSPESPETTPGLEEPTRLRFWSNRLPWLIIGVIIAFWLVSAIGLVWLLNYYRTTISVAPKDSQSPTPTFIAEATTQTEATAILPQAVPVDTPSLPPPFPSPTATKVVDGSNLLAQASSALQQARTGRNRQQAQSALELLNQAESIDSTASAEIARLRSEVLFTLDTLDGTIYLNGENTTRWSLKTTGGGALLNPIDLTISSEGIYIIDSGTLYRGDWPSSTAGDELILTPILTPDSQVSGYPVKEIVAVEVTNTEGDLFALDKANDIYHYRPISDTWQLEIPFASQYSQPNPLYLNLGTFNNRLYILDPARNQIWRHPPNEAGADFLPGTLPWLVEPGEPYINTGIDLTIDGRIYVLQRDGLVVVYSPAETARFDLAAADNLSRVPGWANLPVQPIAIFATTEGTSLHVADPGRRRVVTFNRLDGRVLRQFAAPDNPDFAILRSIAEKDGLLYMLAGSYLYGYNLAEGLDNPPLTGQLPALTPLSAPNIAPDDLLPNDPHLPELLAAYHFQMPLEGALLPDRGAIYPGSRRRYRYGVHQGIDLYGKDIGLENMTVNTPVYAAGDGTIIQANTDYQEMTLEEVNSLLADANARHFTPMETLAKLNGRQVWINHGGGVITRYSHLSGIAEGLAINQPVTAGQLIGYVGLSGTPDGISGNTQFPHLHFEIRLGHTHEYYLGQWLTIEETRRAFERIFKVPVRPAFLEFSEEE